MVSQSPDVDRPVVPVRVSNSAQVWSTQRNSDQVDSPYEPKNTSFAGTSNPQVAGPSQPRRAVLPAGAAGLAHAEHLDVGCSTYRSRARYLSGPLEPLDPVTRSMIAAQRERSEPAESPC